MSILSTHCCILNSGDGAWAFEPLAAQLASSLGIEISDEPRRFNYLLSFDKTDYIDFAVFIPTTAIHLASDKRSLASVFHEHEVPTPETLLFEKHEEVIGHVREHPGKQWCLKYPISCGASGHRLITWDSSEPPNWPRPFIVQEFISLDRPEVYRTYCAGGELFGWVARRFLDGAQSSPWVAHARGARYVVLTDPPEQALAAARRALVATELLNSFGCVDLLRKPTGEWVVLEVGTDGLFNHVDREIGDSNFEGELQQRVAKAFWKAADNSHQRNERVC